MPSRITAYRVFIASPGGLQNERETFRAVLTAYNEADAIERGVVFLPIGWEMTPGGVGRPQQTINKEVRRSDYFVLVLHDHWGSAPQVGPGPYTSGSEEEFSVAQDCHQKGTMRELVVFFKNVDKGKLEDPGEDLKPVLSFKERLEVEKLLMFETFDEPDAFRDRLQRQLWRWVREHERPEREAAGSVIPPPSEPKGTAATTLEPAVEVPLTTGSPAVREAGEMARRGKVTQAERALAQVITADQKSALDDQTFEAWIRYGGLLVQQGSLAKAEEVFLELRKLTRQQGKTTWEVAALEDMARSYVQAGKLDRAEASYREALSIREKTLGPNHLDVAVSLNSLAELLRTQLRFGEAEPLLRRALQIQGVPIGS